MKLLVIGNSTRGIVCSARKAGYTVYAFDNFCDLDLLICADKVHSLGNMQPDRIVELASSLGEFDAVILGPGFEKLGFKNILNNRIQVMEEVTDKLKIAEKLSSLGIPHPDTELLTRVSGDRFPMMIKPRFGSGGVQNAIVRDEDELTSFMARDDAGDFIAQEFVEGIPCSASLIGTGDDVSVVALNEQLIGVPWLTRMPFAYCGNITPFRTEYDKEMVEYTEEIALQFKLVGSNGVDFIKTEKGLIVIEVNPRFQGSLDTVELSTGMNIVDSHIRSFTGELPERRYPGYFAIKTIVFANKKVVIDKKLSDWLIKRMDLKRAADIPRPGWVVQPDEPVTTLLRRGRTRGTVLGKISKDAHYIKVITET